MFYICTACRIPAANTLFSTAQMDKIKTTRKISPVAWVPTAYFAMGLPFVFMNMVAVLMYNGLGVDATTITFWTSLLILPWSLKFLWSPFLELCRTKKIFVVATQLISGVTFGLVAFAIGLPDFFSVSIALLAIIAFSGATHDIACDGVYMSELSPVDQAKYIGWQGCFYNIAKVVATGGLVYVAGLLIEHFGGGKGSSADAVFAANQKAWMIVLLILGTVLVLLSIYHTFILPAGRSNAVETTEKRTAREILNELGNVLLAFFKKKHIVYYIFFIILYRFAEGFVMKIVPLFLKASVEDGGLGLSEKEIGLFYGTFGAGAFVLGSLLAGYYVAARGLKNSLFKLCCIFNIPFVIYALFAIFHPESRILICSGIMFEYFTYGFGFVGLTLFMMQQVAPGKHQMAHYAFASSIMNFGVMLPGMMSGWLCDKFAGWFNSPGGYEPFFIFVLFATIPAFLITYFVPFKYGNDGKLLPGKVD